MINNREVRSIVTKLLLHEHLLVIVLFSGAALSDLAVAGMSRAVAWASAGVMVLGAVALFAGVGHMQNGIVDDAVQREILTDTHLQALYGNRVPRSRRRLLGPAAPRIAGWVRIFLTIATWVLVMVIAIFGDTDDAVARLAVVGAVASLYVALLFALNWIESMLFSGGSTG